MNRKPPPRGAAETFAARLAPLEAILQGEGALPTKSAMLRSKDALVLAGWADGRMAVCRNPPRGAAETLAARLAPLEALLQPGCAGDAEADVGVTKRRREVTAIRWSAGTNRDAPTSTSTHTVSA